MMSLLRLEEMRGAVTTLTLAIALVVDAAGDRDRKLHAAAGRASAAIADALLCAAGDPAHELWHAALRELTAFVEEAESEMLATGSGAAMAVLKAFLSENADS